MPICTSCTQPVPYLYTVYQSAHNLRLEQCTACQAFADPYVEHDELTLLLDLILLKRDVYRHLLYNRGSEPRKALASKNEDATRPGDNKNKRERQRENTRWTLIARLGGGLVIVDAFIRWTHLNPDRPHGTSPWTKETSGAFVRILVGCFVETVAFHIGVILASYIVLNLLDWIRSHRQFKDPSPKPRSGIREEFRFSLIPLTIFYSSLTKLFLLFLLSIWRPGAGPTSSRSSSAPSDIGYENVFITSALEFLDEEKLDREWVVRNVLGGMAAGFGLRVVLDCHPIFTTMIILVGWAVKTAVAGVVSGWVGDERTGEAFLAYSIP